MKCRWLAAVAIFAAMIAACSSNSTPTGITVTAAGVAAGATATVLENQTLQFSASITGGGAAQWQICLPATQVNTQPTDCTAVPGVTSTSTTVLSGYGTITQTGLYTAPNAIPSPNSFLVMASSTSAPTTTYGTMNMQIDSGIRVQLNPSAVTIGTGEHFQFTKTVTGTSNTAVTWAVNGIAGGNITIGFICPNPAVTCAADGEYFAPVAVPGAVTVSAASVADASKTASASVSVVALVAPVATTIDPITSEQGAAQQDVYITGQNFLTTDVVYAIPPNASPIAVPTVLIGTTLLRATIPGSAMSKAGALPLQVQDSQSSAVSGQVSLNLVAVRPGLIAVTPDTVTQTASGASINLTGGFFSPNATTVQFNGSASGVTPSFVNSRQLSIGIPNPGTPGLYPVTVQNSGVTAGQSSSASLNLSVSPISVPTAPIGSVTVGSNPSAVAIDYASDVAVVVNTGNGTSAGTVSLINLATTPPTIVNTIPVGIAPTGVAIDDLLSPHVALVVNSSDQTVTAINLTTQTVISTLSVAIGPTTGSPAGTAPVPYAIGINSLTHRALVAYESFNEATVLDLSTGTPQLLPGGSQVGSDITASIGTGTSPAIVIDPRLNWALISPGGGGIQTTSIVDLGHNAGVGDPVVRAPEVIGSVGISAVGVALNAETHQALLADPNSSVFTTFRLLDNSVNTITFTNNGTPITQLGYDAAAANPLTNVAVVVNGNSSIATVVNMETGVLLGNVTLPSGPAQAVAIDPISNEAVVVSQASSTASVLSLVPTPGSLNPDQIIESSPATTFTSSAALNLMLTGGVFTGSSTAQLDGTPLTTNFINARQLSVTVPASMLGAARRYAVQVKTGPAVSNVVGLTVVQAIPVGSAPVGVAVDTDRDLAVVTNSGSNTVSLVALSPTTPAGINQLPFGSVGTMGQPISVGLNPLGVAVLPRSGLALVANNGSNNVSLVDVTQTNPPQTVADCSAGSVCTGQTGVAINQDTAVGVVTNSTSNNNIANNNSNDVSYVGITPATSTAAAAVTPTNLLAVDLDPTAVAVDPLISSATPGLGYAAVTSASQASSIEIFSMPDGSFVQRLLGLQNPTGIIFDSVNQVFLAADSLLNQVVIIDPNAFSQTPLRVGINPTALAYDYQTSTLVTVNEASNTLSLLDYMCPPPAAGVASTCPNPQVQAVLGFEGSQQFSVDVDPKLNLAVVADQNNNRVLLIPLSF